MKAISSFRSATNFLSPIKWAPEINGLELSINIASLRDLPTDSRGATAITRKQHELYSLSQLRGSQHITDNYPRLAKLTFGLTLIAAPQLAGATTTLLLLRHAASDA